MNADMIFQEFLNTMYKESANSYSDLRGYICTAAVILLLLGIVLESIKRTFDPKFLSMFEKRQLFGLGFIAFIGLGLISVSIHDVSTKVNIKRAFREDPSDEKIITFVKMVEDYIKDQKQKEVENADVRTKDP